MLAGVAQSVRLSVSAGSRSVAAGSIVALKSSPGLHFDKDLLVIPNEIAAFEFRSFSVGLRSSFCDQWTSKGVVHEVVATAGWEDGQDGHGNRSEAQAAQVRIKLLFMPPFVVTHKLLTCDTAKFIQVRSYLTSIRTKRYSAQRCKYRGWFANNIT